MCVHQPKDIRAYFFFFFFLIYSAVSGLGCVGESSVVMHFDSLVVTCRLGSCGAQAPEHVGFSSHGMHV